MKIAFVTDLHIDESFGPVHDVPTYDNFRAVIGEIKEWQPDHIIVGGDICFKAPVKAVYEQVREDLDNSGIPFSVISGNHDDPGMLSQIFFGAKTVHDNEHYFSKTLGRHQFIFLDTTTGQMSDRQWNWLTVEIAKSNDKTVYIAMHHPPCYAGVPYMDTTHAFNEIDKFRALANGFDARFTILTGHYHVERTILVDNMRVLITPSCFVQIDADHVDFKVDHTIPSYRKIHIDDSGCISDVCYVRK